MPPFRRRPLIKAAMVGGAGYVTGERHEAVGADLLPAASTRVAAPIDDAASEANRLDALTKLKGLLDSGVLTREQYDSEHARLTEGI